jgi:hypothetical protein
VDDGGEAVRDHDRGAAWERDRKVCGMAASDSESSGAVAPSLWLVGDQWRRGWGKDDLRGLCRGIVEDVRILGDDSDATLEAVMSGVVDVHAVDGDSTGLDIVDSSYQVRDGCLPAPKVRPRRPTDRVQR